MMNDELYAAESMAFIPQSNFYNFESLELWEKFSNIYLKCMIFKKNLTFVEH